MPNSSQCDQNAGLKDTTFWGFWSLSIHDNLHIAPCIIHNVNLFLSENVNVIQSIIFNILLCNVSLQDVGAHGFPELPILCSAQ